MNFHQNFQWEQELRIEKNGSQPSEKPVANCCLSALAKAGTYAESVSACQ